MNHMYCENCRVKLNLPSSVRWTKEACLVCGQTERSCHFMPSSNMTSEQCGVLLRAIPQPKTAWERLNSDNGL